jgi:hypothetical protein
MAKPPQNGSAVPLAIKFPLLSRPVLMFKVDCGKQRAFKIPGSIAIARESFTTGPSFPHAGADIK